MKTALLLTVLLALGWAATCEAQYPAIVVEAVEPDTSWERIYHEVEDCVGMKDGKYEVVRWFVTERPWAKAEGDSTYGLWYVSDGKPRIIVAAYDTAVVRHEALHDVLWRNGFKPFRIPADSSNNPEHPMPPFGLCAKRAF